MMKQLMQDAFGDLLSNLKAFKEPMVPKFDALGDVTVSTHR